MDRDAALALFDASPAVTLGELTGRWRGRGLPTGCRLDGLLEAYGWWGKEFVEPDAVHPLLFADIAGLPRPVNPALAPLGLLLRAPWLFRTRGARAAFTVVRPLITTSRPVARARTVRHRGVDTAAIVYDSLPVIDVLRQTEDGPLLGLMDLRGLEEPFFFLLEPDDDPADDPDDAEPRRQDGDHRDR